MSGRHTGITDIPLTENGRRAAKRLETALTKETFTAVLTSPLERARKTSELAGFGGRAEIEFDLMEWNYGEYEGLTSKQIREKVPGWILFRDGCPGGESPEQIGARVDRRRVEHFRPRRVGAVAEARLADVDDVVRDRTHGMRPAHCEVGRNAEERAKDCDTDASCAARAHTDPAVVPA